MMRLLKPCVMLRDDKMRVYLPHSVGEGIEELKEQWMANKWNVAGKWNTFVSLNWYDGLIDE